MTLQCQLEELDSISFVHCFKWYELVEKPKFRVMGYTVKPAENRLYQVFSWLASGCKPEKILEMIEDLERSLHAAFAAGMEEERGVEDAVAHQAAPDTGESSGEQQVEQVPQRRLQSVSESSPIASPKHHRGPGAAAPVALQSAQDHGKTAAQQRPAVRKDDSTFFSEESRVVVDSSERCVCAKITRQDGAHSDCSCAVPG